jgi:hypothetical protein
MATTDTGVVGLKLELLSVGQDVGEFEQDLLEELAEGWLPLWIARLRGEEPGRQRAIQRTHKREETGKVLFNYLSFGARDKPAPTVAGSSYPAPKGLKERVLEAELRKLGVASPQGIPGTPTPAAVRSWKFPNWAWVVPGMVLKPQEGRKGALLTLRGADPRWVGEDVRVRVRGVTPLQLTVKVDVVSLGETHPWGAAIQVQDLMGGWEETREAPEWAKPGAWVRLKSSTGTVRRVSMVTGDLVRIDDDCGQASIVTVDWEPVPAGERPGESKALFPAWAQRGARLVPKDLGSPWRRTLRGLVVVVSEAVVAEIRDRAETKVYVDLWEGGRVVTSAAGIDWRDLENFWEPKKSDQVPLSGEDIRQAVKESWELPTWAKPGKWIKRESGKTLYEVIGKNGDGTFSAWEYDLLEGGDPMLLPATKTTTSIRCLDRWMPVGEPGPSWQKRMARAMRTTGAQLKLRDSAAMPEADLNRDWPVVVLEERHHGVLVAPVGRHRESFLIPDSQLRTDWRLVALAPGAKAFGQEKPELPAGLKAGRRVRVKAGGRAGKAWEHMRYAVVQAVDGDWAIRLVGCAPYQEHKMTVNLGAFLADWELLPEEGLPVWVQPGMRVALKKGEPKPEYWPFKEPGQVLEVVGLLPHGGVELKGPEGLPLNLHPEYVARSWEPVLSSHPDWLRPDVRVQLKKGGEGTRVVAWTAVVRDVRGLLTTEVVIEWLGGCAPYPRSVMGLLDFLDKWEPIPEEKPEGSPEWLRAGVRVQRKEGGRAPASSWAEVKSAVVEEVAANSTFTMRGYPPYEGSPRVVMSLRDVLDNWEPILEEGGFPEWAQVGKPIRMKKGGKLPESVVLSGGPLALVLLQSTEVSVRSQGKTWDGKNYLVGWKEDYPQFTVMLEELTEWEPPVGPAVSGSVPKMPRQWTKEQLAMSCVDAKLRLKAGAPVPWHGLAHHMDIVTVIGAKSVGYVRVKAAGASKPFELDPDTLFRDWELWFEAPYDKPLPSWVKVGRLMRLKASPSMVYGISSVEGGRVLAWKTPDGQLEEVVNLWCEWEPLEKEIAPEVGFPEWVKSGALIRTMGRVDPEKYKGKRATVGEVKNQGRESFLRARLPGWGKFTLPLVQFEHDWEYDPEFPEDVQSGLLIRRKEEATRVAKISNVYNRPNSPYRPYLCARWERGGGELTLLRDAYLEEWEPVPQDSEDKPDPKAKFPEWVKPGARMRLGPGVRTEPEWMAKGVLARVESVHEEDLGSWGFLEAWSSQCPSGGTFMIPLKSLTEWEPVRPPNLLTKPDWIIPDADIRLKESGKGPSGILWEGVREARIDEVSGMVSPEVQLKGPKSQRVTLPILEVMDNWEPAPFREYPEWIKPGIKIRVKGDFKQDRWSEVLEVVREPSPTESPQPFAVCKWEDSGQVTRLDLEKLVEHWEVVQGTRFPDWVYPRVWMRRKGHSRSDVNIVRVTYAPTGSLTVRDLRGRVSELYLQAFLKGGWELVAGHKDHVPVPKARSRKKVKTPVPVKSRKRVVKKRKS